MSRFPSTTLADRIDDRVQELGDGFVRLGEEDTPFTLREGGESLGNARQLHSERDESERERDEESNEPLTRFLPEWQEDMIGLDFPFVDTIPLNEQRRRANQVAELATTENVVENRRFASTNGALAVRGGRSRHEPIRVPLGDVELRRVYAGRDGRRSNAGRRGSRGQRWVLRVRTAGTTGHDGDDRRPGVDRERQRA